MRRARRHAATAGLAVLGAVVIWLVSTRVFPYHSINHDEAVYLQQAAMLLEGQLNLWPPLEDAFRPWFFVDAGEHLYPKYAPVPAAIFAIGELLGAYRLALPAVAGGFLALVVGVVREAFDARTGLVAAAFVLCSPLFLLDAAVFLPYAPTTLLNLTFAYAYLRADRLDSVRWAVVAGAAIGLAFFARPYTAFLFALPFVGHALWTLAHAPREALLRQLATAGVGLLGVGLTLGYNAVLVGSPFEFPYQSFAPLDGLGFGTRRLLGHEVEYTIDLAIRANTDVLAVFATKWVAGGLVGIALATAGLAIAVRRGLSPRQAPLAGLIPSIVLGNLYFWGNLNILGDLDEAGDGLIASLGPYYHFDLLVPVAVFAAMGVLAGSDWLQSVLRREVASRDAARAAFAIVLLLGGAVFGAATVTAIDEPLDRNQIITDTYERAYQPFEETTMSDALVLVPDPYGDWLNHPFQVLRNDPGFDGDVVYAIDDRPFRVIEAVPNRTTYRYTYRGAWAPPARSPEAARLQQLTTVAGDRISLRTTIGVPPGAESVTLRLGDAEGAYAVLATPNESTSFRVVLVDGRARIGGAAWSSDEVSVPIADRESLTLTAFVDYGPSGGFTYRIDLPVTVGSDRIRALTPRLEWCRFARLCGGAATYVPGETPAGVFVETSLSAERNV